MALHPRLHEHRSRYRLGRYEIRAKIGEGGMGEVYLALDTLLPRNVALKVLSADLDELRRLMSTK